MKPSAPMALLCFGLCALLHPTVPAHSADPESPSDPPAASQADTPQPADAADENEQQLPPAEAEPPSTEDEATEPEAPDADQADFEAPDPGAPDSDEPAPGEEEVSPPETAEPDAQQATEEEPGQEPTEGEPQQEEPKDEGPSEPEPTEAEELGLDDQTDLIAEDSGEAATVSDVVTFQIKPSAAVGADREPDPPRYVRSLARHAERFGLEGLEQFDWLQLGIEQRTRFEIRNNYYRVGGESGELAVMRTRGYLGVREVLDPLRFGFEFQDARRFGDAIDDRSNIDQADILQLFGELYFPDFRVTDYPLRVRFGRMSFDSIDRRLVARNRFRNTVNAYDGFRVTFGRRTTDWEIDLFTVMPVDIRPFRFNESNDDVWLTGATAYWRGWSPYVTLEPYYFFLDRDESREMEDLEAQTHTLGLHGFGVLGQSGFDYDFNVAFQFGDDRDGDRSQRAFAMHGEVGYMWDTPARPRLAAWINYASGDRDPNDGVNGRFDRLFGASHSMFGYSDLWTWQNMINPTVYLSVRPTSDLRVEALYRAYWLASKRDAWVVPGLQDPTGNSGRYVGQEVDLRIKYQIGRHAGIDFGYALFLPGSFVSDTTPDDDVSNFFYVQLTLRF